MDFGGNVLDSAEVDLTDIASDVLPRDECVYDVGSAAKRFKSAHFCEGDFNPVANSTTSFRIRRRVSGPQDTKMFNVDSINNTVDVGNENSTINIGETGSTVIVAGQPYSSTSTNVENGVGGTLPIVLADGVIPGSVTLRQAQTGLSYVDVGDGLLQVGGINATGNTTVSGANNTSKFRVLNNSGVEVFKVSTTAETTSCNEFLVFDKQTIGGSNRTDKFKVQNNSTAAVLEVDTTLDEVRTSGTYKGDSIIVTGNVDADTLTTTQILDQVGFGQVIISANLFPSNTSRQLGSAILRWSILNTIDINASGDTEFAGTVVINGLDTTDKFRVRSDLGGDVFVVNTVNGITNTRTTVPLTADTYDLGTSSNRWENVYTNAVRAPTDQPSATPNLATTCSHHYHEGRQSIVNDELYGFSVFKTGDFDENGTFADLPVFSVNTTLKDVNVFGDLNCVQTTTLTDLTVTSLSTLSDVQITGAILWPSSSVAAIQTDTSASKKRILINASVAGSSTYNTTWGVDWANAEAPMQNGIFMLKDSSVSGNWIGFWAGSTRGSITWNGSNLQYLNTSDRKQKDMIVDDEDDDLDKMMKIKCRKFRWKDRMDKQVSGLIAQEVQEIYPDVVGVVEDDESEKDEITLGISYMDLVPKLIHAMQQQEKTIRKMNRGMENMRKTIEALENRIILLEN